jgi:hypothetical protein
MYCAIVVSQAKESGIISCYRPLLSFLENVAYFIKNVATMSEGNEFLMHFKIDC